MDGREERTERIAWICALVAVAALIASPLRGHVDDMDAQMYLVIARNLARERSWFDLHFLPGWLPQFREHLPFGFWPAAATIRLLGEGWVPVTYGLLTLTAVAVAGSIAKRIGGPWAGIAAILLLGTCESIWQYGARPLLEPPLLLFATAAAAAALADRWGWAAILGAVAVLIKGPFGLVPVAAVALARLPRWRGPMAVTAAALPLFLFLFLDPAGGWREGYLHHQLLASATGGRSDGVVLWWFPISVVVRRFWPGLPFVILGVWQAIHSRRARPLTLSCLLMIAFLCVPSRKWGNHTYVAFPLLAAMAGTAASQLLRPARRPPLAAGATAFAAVVALVFLASGLGARVLRPPCVFSTALAPSLRSLSPGTPLLVVTPEPDLSALTELAAEFRLPPRPVRALAVARDETYAVTHAASESEGWRPVSAGQGWTLLRKQTVVVHP